MVSTGVTFDGTRVCRIVPYDLLYTIVLHKYLTFTSWHGFILVTQHSPICSNRRSQQWPSSCRVEATGAVVSD